jgi:hypothetical protein
MNYFKCRVNPIPIITTKFNIFFFYITKLIISSLSYMVLIISTPLRLSNVALAKSSFESCNSGINNTDSPNINLLYLESDFLTPTVRIFHIEKRHFSENNVQRKNLAYFLPFTNSCGLRPASSRIS